MTNEVPSQHPFKVLTKPTHVGFLLLQNFTMMALSSAVEPLRMANQLSGRELYSWGLVSSDGQPVKASDGISVAVDHSTKTAPAFDTLIVVGGVDITRSCNRAETEWLQLLDRRNTVLGGICTGAYALASAHLLDDYSISAHWECIAALKESFPKVNTNSRLFTIDNNRITASGGIAPMDMMLHLISMHHGNVLATAIMEMFVCDRMRNPADQQKIPLRHLLNTAQPKLVEIVELMEANIEEPIELCDLAEFAGISRRQLERLFHNYLDCTPSRYYLKLRLERAKQLLKQTTMPIIEISAACGFVSTPHFSRCYRKYMNQSPRQERAGTWNEKADEGYEEVLEGETLFMDEAPSAKRASPRSEPSFGSVKIGSTGRSVMSATGTYL